MTGLEVLLITGKGRILWRAAEACGAHSDAHPQVCGAHLDAHPQACPVIVISPTGFTSMSDIYI